MDVAALITWLITAVFGFTMLGLWVSGGGVRAAGASGSNAAADAGAGSTSAGATTTVAAGTRFPPALVFGHFLLAAAGLVIWIWYLFADTEVLTWVAFAILVVVAVLGDLLFLRWYRDRDGSTVEARRLPRPVVYTHGLFAVATLVLVLLVALGVGES